MIAVAEQSNSLETVLPTIADSLEKETWRRLDLFVRLLEPVMLLILASAVLVIVIALLLPMIKSATALVDFGTINASNCEYARRQSVRADVGETACAATRRG